MGKGLVNPIDDLRETNPPSNPELLDALADEFVDGGFDLKKLLRLILNSRVYQLSALPTPDNRLDTTFFTHYPLKRLTAEQLLDAINVGDRHRREVPAPARRHPRDRAARHELPVVLPRHLRPPPPRASPASASARPTRTSSQALHLMNGDLVNRKVAQPDGRLAQAPARPEADRRDAGPDALPRHLQPPRDRRRGPPPTA